MNEFSLLKTPLKNRLQFRMVDYEKMRTEHPRVDIFLKGLFMLVAATLLSILLTSPLIIFDVDMQIVVFVFTFPVDIIPIPFNLIGIPLIPIGLLLVAWANYTLLHIGKIGLRAREPMQTPSNLVTTGPYRYTRNPIYLSCILMLLGLVLVWSSLVVFLGMIIVYIIFRYKFISREEIILEEAFGDEYRSFKKRVRRWL